MIDHLGDLFCEFLDVFSTSKTDVGSCFPLPCEICVYPYSPPVTPRPYRVNPILAKHVDAVLDQYFEAGFLFSTLLRRTRALVVIPEKAGGVGINVNSYIENPNN